MRSIDLQEICARAVRDEKKRQELSALDRPSVLWCCHDAERAHLDRLELLRMLHLLPASTP